MKSGFDKNSVTDNKYYRWYLSIVENRINSPVPVGTYTEQHHIVPQSMGGSNANSNLVKLTAREHYLCHRLLPKFISNKEDRHKMYRAIFLMGSYSKYAVNKKSKFYQQAREDFVERQSNAMRGKTSPWSIEDIHKKAIKTRTERGTNVFITNNPMKCEESKQKKVEQTSGDNHYTKNKLSFYYRTEQSDWSEIVLRPNQTYQQWVIEQGWSEATYNKCIKMGEDWTPSRGKMKGIYIMRKINED